jgi:lysophospholipase L1-like esterase
MQALAQLGLQGFPMAIDSKNPLTVNGSLSSSDRALTAGALRKYAPSAFYNLKPSNTLKLRAAMASASANCNVLCIGPSTTAGESTGQGTTQAVNSWVAQLADRLSARGIPAGANNRFGCMSSLWSYLIAADGRVSATGGVSQGGTVTAGGNSINIPVGGTFSFTPQKPVDTFIVTTYATAASRSFRLTAGTGTPVAVSQAVAGVITNTTVTADALGTKTLLLDNVVGGTVVIVGVRAFDNSRREISLLNWGVSGARADQLIENTDTIAGRLAMITAFAAPGAILDDLAINDWRQGIAVATTQASITTLANRVISAGGNPILTTPLFDGGTAGTTAQQDLYAAMTFDVADTLDLPVIDVRSSWVSYAAANGLSLYSDTVHPLAKGYAMKAALMTEFFSKLRGM